MRRSMRMLAAVCAVAAHVNVWAADAPVPGSGLGSGLGADHFERRVRPVLVKHCFKCHSRQAEERKGGLLLDSRAGLLEGGDSGPAIVPGDVDKSLLIRAIRYGDEDLQMPPKQALPSEVVAAIERWVAEGAQWPEAAGVAGAGSVEQRIEAARRTHWSLKPIGRPTSPAVEGDASWATNEIDRYVLATLRASGLTPSPMADRRTLVRRAYIDLIGLPPTYEQVRAFEADESAEAWAKLIDELLARPEYGERWGRHWLDVARYSDTKGYVDAGEPKYPFAWTYRDYVIRALNADVPYDRFVMEQIAGDRVAEREDDPAWAAMGFLTVGSRFNFFPNEVIDDRIDVVTRGLMGLTVACARCHDHKYDPVTQGDYYALYGVFAASYEPPPDRQPVVPLGGETAALSDEAAKQVAEKSAALRDGLRELHERIMREMRSRARDYLVYIVQTNMEHRTQIQPPYRTERGLLREGSAYGEGGVIRWRRHFEAVGPDDAVFGLWNRMIALKRHEVGEQLVGTLEQMERDGRINALVASAVREAAPKSMLELAEVYGTLLERIDAEWLEYAKANEGAAAFEDVAKEQLRQVLYAEGGPPTMTIDESWQQYQLDEHVKARSLFGDLERVYLGAGAKVPHAMAMRDHPRPTQAYVFLRGDPGKRGPNVERRFIEMLWHVDGGKSFADGSGRLELARAVVSRENPLTARVIANRVWLWHFGRGLAESPSNFGLASPPPSHPELLDHLAATLMDRGWSLKALHRHIMLSSTYRQSSKDRPECSKADPDNRLLWRMNRRRVEFEALRDGLLYVSGRLDASRGGPPETKPLDAPQNTRRTIYCMIDREKLPGVLRVFDFPSPDLSSPQRPQTTVPQQALFMLNNRLVMHTAEQLIERLDAEGGSTQSDEQRVAQLFRWVYGRDPVQEELRLALEYIEPLMAEYVAAEAKEPEPSPWQYGYGPFDPATGKLESFTPLPHFDGSFWQGGPMWPDPALSYLRLTPEGGHAGIDLNHTLVRRWVSPIDGVVRFKAMLSHGEEEQCGDGVRASVVSSRSGLLGQWMADKQRVETRLEGIEVKRGDTLDFVIDMRENHMCDMFLWSPVVTAGSGEGGGKAWDARQQFTGGTQTPKPLSPWASFAHALLQSNEFLFVD